MMPRYSRQEPMDLNDFLENTKSEFLSSPNSAQCIELINSLKDLMDEEEFELDCLRNDEAEDIEELYLEKEENQTALAQKVFDIIVNKIVRMSNANPLSHIAPKKLYKKANNFTQCIDFHEHGSAYSSRSQSSCLVDKYLPDNCRFFKGLETVAVQSKQALGEYLVTGYHQSGLSRSQYIAQLVLFGQLEELYGKSSYMMEKMIEYLIEWERMIAKPLPHNRDTPLNIPKYTDSSTIISNYMIEINHGIKTFLTTGNAKYPTQFDVFFVAPDTHKELNLHQLRGLQHYKKLNKDNNDNIDGEGGVYRLLRDAAADLMNTQFGQRFIMLIVRGNKEDSNDDTIYIFKPNTHNSVPNGSVISDYVELLWLLNSKTDIVPGLASNAEGVLGFTHHLHSQTCNKSYLSYGDYKSRVFKHDLLHKLEILMDSTHEKNNNDKLGKRLKIVSNKKNKTYAMSQWYFTIEEEEEMDDDEVPTADTYSIPENVRVSFMNHYHEFPDKMYHKYGKYWFSNDASYECYEPYTNPANCRANGNIFIPKTLTPDLREYVRETFNSVQKLYYNLDYTIAMQIVDKQIVFFELDEYYNSFGVVPTELHKKQTGELLYAVIVQNNLPKKNQKWKIKEYAHISQAFMTANELVNKYGIFVNDLPKGSKAKHDAFSPQLNNIQVNEALLRKTDFHDLHIVHSKQTTDKMRQAAMVRADMENVAARLSEKEFTELAINALKTTPLTPMAYVQFRKHQYKLEKLLPVYIQEYDRYVAISFCFDEEHKTYATGLCFDMVDMKNKVNLVDTVPSDSWLNHKSCQNLVKLEITKHNIPRHKSRARSSRRSTPEPQVVKHTMQRPSVPQYIAHQVQQVQQVQQYNTPPQVPQIAPQFIQAQQLTVISLQYMQSYPPPPSHFYVQQAPASTYNTMQNYAQPVSPYNTMNINNNYMQYYPQ